jgi:hypothetical protein
MRRDAAFSGNDDELDAARLLRGEQVIHQQLDGLADQAASGEPVVVRPAGELPDVPVSDRLEELDVAGHLALGRDDEEDPILGPPESVSANRVRKADSDRTVSGK